MDVLFRHAFSGPRSAVAAVLPFLVVAYVSDARATTCAGDANLTVNYGSYCFWSSGDATASANTTYRVDNATGAFVTTQVGTLTVNSGVTLGNGGNYALYFSHVTSNAGSDVVAVNNSGTLVGAAGWAAIGLNGANVGTITNQSTGIIGSTSASSDGLGGGSNSLTTLNNYGAILNGAGGYGVHGIHITTFNNAQGGSGNANGAVTLYNYLPTNYNVVVNSATSYGQLAVSSPSGSMAFGVAASSTLAVGSYAGVLSGVASGSISNSASTVNVWTNFNTLYKWELVAGTGTNVWDLVVALRATDIATNGTVYDAANLGSTVNSRFDGGTLQITSNGTITSDFGLTSQGGKIDQNGLTSVFSGALTDDTLGAEGRIIIINTGTAGVGKVTLSGSNSHTGGTEVRAGATLSIAAGSALGAGGLDLVGSADTPATLHVSANTSISNAITVTGDPVFDIASGTTTTISSAISGTGEVVVSGGGTLVLSAANTYTGLTAINAGTLALTGAGSIASSLGVVANGTFDISGTTSGAAIADLSGAGSVVLGAKTLVITNATSTFDGVISGAGGVTLDGGALTLTGANTYSGGTIINAGTLTGNTTSLQGDFTNNATLVFNQAANGTFAGAISGTGSLTKTGVGDLTLTGANSYSGGTTISAGALTGNTTSLQGDITNNATLVFDQAANGTFAGAVSGTGSLTKTGAGVLTLTGANSYSGGTTISAGALSGNTTSLQGDITNNATLVFNQTSNGTFSGAVSGTGSLTKTGAGTLTLTGANTYSGSTTISGGALQVGAGGIVGALGTGAIVNNGALVLNRSDAFALANDVSGTGSLSIVGAGGVTLSSATTYTGATNIAADATLSLSGVGAIASSSSVTNDGVLDVSATTNGATIKEIHGAGSVALGAKTLHVQSGVNSIGGLSASQLGGLVIDSGASLSLGGQNTSFEGKVTVEAGSELVLGAASALGSGSLALVGAPTSSATLSTTASMTLNGTITVASDPTFNVANGTTLTIASAISDGVSAGDVVVTGGGTLQLTSANAYTGVTTIMAGSTLALSGQGAVATSSRVVNAGVLNLTGSTTGSVVLGGSYAQTGALVLGMAPAGAQTLAIAGAANLGGTVQIVAAPGAYAKGRYALVTSGALSGTFTSYSSNLSAYTNLYTSIIYENNAAYLYLGSSPDGTWKSIQQGSATMRHQLAARGAALTSTLGYDSNYFGPKNWSVSFIGRYDSLAGEKSEGAGALVAAYRFTPRLRLGIFIDANRPPDVSGAIRHSDAAPSVGGFLAYEENADLTGWSARASVVNGRDRMTITRSAVDGAEPGAGAARVRSAGMAGEFAYGFGADGLVVQPYLGLRRTFVKRDAYAESKNGGVVSTPVAYDGFQTRQASVTAGMRLHGTLGWLGFVVTAGGEYDLDRKMDSYSGASVVPGLETFSLAMPAASRRLRANASIATVYALAPTQRLSLEGAWRQQAFTSTSAFMSTLKYTIGF